MCIYGYLFYTLIAAGLLSLIYSRNINKSENFVSCRIVNHKSDY